MLEEAVSIKRFSDQVPSGQFFRIYKLDASDKPYLYAFIFSIRMSYRHLHIDKIIADGRIGEGNESEFTSKKTAAI